VHLPQEHNTKPLAKARTQSIRMGVEPFVNENSTKTVTINEHNADIL